MKQLRFYPFIRDYFLKHPVLFYAFILPVYLPVRSLGEDFPVYHFLIYSDYERIFYFLYVLFQSAIAGVVLSLILRILLKRKILAESHLLSHMRVMGLLFVLLFTLTTYWILRPVSVTGLYLASGAHYVCSAFLANLVILEAKHYRLPLSAKNNDIAKAIGSGVFGLNVDILGILAYGVMSLFVDYVGVQYYIRFCIGLEVAFFFYLLLVRRYWHDVLLLIATKARFITVFISYTLSIMCCMLIALLAAHTHYVLCLSLIAVWVLYRLLYKQVGRETLFALFTGNIAYGSVIVVLMSPIFILAMPDESHALLAYTQLLPLESMISGAVMGFILWLVCKRVIKTETSSTCRYIFKHSIVIILMPLILFCLGVRYEAIFVLAFFLLYSYIESTTRYGVRELILSAKSDLVATRLNYYNFLIWRGVVPTLFFLVIEYLEPLRNTHLTLVLSSATLSTLALLLCVCGLVFVVKRKRSLT